MTWLDVLWQLMCHICLDSFANSGFAVLFIDLSPCLYADDRISMECNSSQAILTINNTESTDTGCYSVELVNIHGSERMYSSVTIEGMSCPWFYTYISLLVVAIFLSYNDCLEDKREDYQNCSVVYCVTQYRAQSYAHWYEQFLQVNCFRFRIYFVLCLY